LGIGCTESRARHEGQRGQQKGDEKRPVQPRPVTQQARGGHRLSLAWTRELSQPKVEYLFSGSQVQLAEETVGCG
jgi:hypothetical protein